MRDVGIRFVVDDTQKSKFASMATAAAAAARDVNARINLGFNPGQMDYALNRLGITAAFVSGVALRNLQTQVVNVAGAFSYLGKEFVSVNEKFSVVQINLGSALRSFTAARDIVRELGRITASSPLPFEQLGHIAQSLAAQPQTSSRLLQQANSGKIGDRNGFMQNTIKTIESMAVFRPDQGAEGAIFAIREALGGQLRSLTRRFDISSRLLSTVSRKSTKELTDDPDLMLGALNKVFTGIIDPAAVAAQARQPKILMQNIKEQAMQLPMYMIGSSGISGNDSKSPYAIGLVKIQETFDKLVDFMSNNFETRFAPRIKDALIRSGGKIEDAFTATAEKVFTAFGLGSGPVTIERTVDALTTALTKFLDFIGKAAEKFGKSDIVSRITDVFNDVKKFATDVFNIFSPIIKQLVSLISTVTGANSSTLLTALTLGMPLILSNLGTIVTMFTKLGTDTFPRLANAVIEFTKRGMIPGGTPATQPGLVGGIFGNAPGQIPSGVDLLLAKSRVGGGAVNSNTGGRNLLGQGAVSTFGQPGANQMYGLNYQSYWHAQPDYRNAFRENPALTAALENKYGGRAPDIFEENRRLRAVLAADQQLLAKNPGQYNAFVRQNGSKALIGISLAEETERLHREQEANKPMSFGRKVGNFALGTAMGVGIGLAVDLLYKGAVSVYEAFTRAANAADRLAGEDKDRIDKLASDLDSPQTDVLSSFFGNRPSATLAKQSEEFSAYSQTDTILRRLEKDSKTGKFVRPSFTTSDTAEKAIAMMGYGEFNSEAAGEKLEEIKADQIFGKTGFNKQSFGLFVKNLTDSKILAPKAAADFVQKFDRNATEAINGVFEILDRLPQVTKRLQEISDEKYKKVLDEQKKNLDDAVAAAGPFGELIKTLSSGAMSAQNVNEVRAAGEKASGVQKVRSIISQGMRLNANALHTDIDLEIENRYQKENKLDYYLQNAKKMEADRLKVREEISGLGDMFNQSQASMESMIDDLVSGKNEAKSDQGKEIINKLIETAKKIKNGERDDKGNLIGGSTMKEHMAALKAQLDELTHLASSTGATFDFVFKSTGQVLETMLTSLESTTPEKIREQLAKMNEILAVGDPDLKLPRFSKELISERTSGKKEATPLARLKDDIKLREEMQNVITQYSNSSGVTEDQMKLVKMLRLAVKTSEEDFLKPLKAQAGAENSKIIGTADFKTGAFGPQKSDFDANLERAGFTRDEELLRKRTNFPISTGNTQAVQLQRQLNQNKLQELPLLADKKRNEEAINAILAIRREIERDIKALEESQKPSSFFENLKESAMTAQDQLYDFAQAGRQMGAIIKDSFSEAFGSIVTGTQNVSQAFRQMASSIAASMARILAQKAAEFLLNTIFASFMSGPAPTPSGYNLGGSPQFLEKATVFQAPGAPIPQFKADGGRIHGGSGIRDDVPIMAMGGEFVIKKESAQRIGYDRLHALNDGRLPRFAEGGVVGSVNMPVLRGVEPAGARVVNVNVTVNNNGGKSTTTSSTDDKTPDMKDFIAGITALVDERLLNAQRANGFLNPAN